MKQQNPDPETLGESITAGIENYASIIWRNDVIQSESALPYNYGNSALNSAAKILASVMIDRLWVKVQKENTTSDERLKLVGEMGDDLRSFIKKYLDIDMHEEIKKMAEL